MENYSTLCQVYTQCFFLGLVPFPHISVPLLKDLALAENSPGRDGTEYILIFQADILELTPFELPFRFYNGQSYSHPNP